jgi:hypothetical protein
MRNILTILGTFLFFVIHPRLYLQRLHESMDDG